MRSLNIIIATAISTSSILWAPPSYSKDIKFGKTCVSTTNNASNVCVAFNGKSATSTYKHEKKYPTKGTHTGCTTTEKAIKCTGGRWSSGGNSGTMGPVTIKLSNGKPTSMTWSK